VPPPAGAVNVCATELSPLNGVLLPTIAEAVPPCAVVEIAVVPVLVQPVRPLSKPPFVMPLAGGAVTVRVTVVACVALVAVPVIVTVYVPVAVVAPTESVSVELPPAVTETGLNAAVVPEGRPLALSATDSAVPLVTAVEIVEVAVPPWTAETLEGVALIEKSFGGGGAVTVRVTVVECAALGAVPVTVRVYVPAAAVPAPTVSVELPPVVTEVGLKVAVAPAGAPVTVRLTVSAVPLVTAVEMVDVPLAPCASERLVGLALIEKSFGGGAVTVRVTVVECVALGAVPVTVRVYVPAAAVPAPTVSVEPAPAVTEVGLSVAVAPAGVPLTVKLIVSAVPPVTAVEIVDVPLAP